MATWSSLLVKSAALLNDQDRAVYTDTVLLPYLNIALSELQEVFELNNIPVTSETSAVLAVPSNTSAIAFSGTTPVLPADLIEIQELWESQAGQNIWIPVNKKEFLTPYILGNSQTSIFGVWAWLNQQIRLIGANTPIDLKLDYIRSIFTELTIPILNAQNTILNTDTFIYYRVAALAAEFIDENVDRSTALNTFSSISLNRSLGISIKGQQPIAIRRQPFRAAWKRMGNYL